MGEVPEVVGLTRGWFGFNLHWQEQFQCVFSQNWLMDHTPVLFKPSHLQFDASSKRGDLVPIWVRLPGLSMHYWSEEHFCSIGNILGAYLEVDMSFKETKLLRVAHILVKINIRQGLA